MKVGLSVCVLNRAEAKRTRKPNWFTDPYCRINDGQLFMKQPLNECLAANVSQPLVRATGSRKGELLFLCLLFFNFPSLTDPSVFTLVFPFPFFFVFLRLFEFLCVSLSPPPKDPLVCLTRLWLHDLCIHCVIIVPASSSESLAEWLLTKANWSLCVLPAVFIYLHFMCCSPSSSLFLSLSLTS